MLEAEKYENLIKACTFFAPEIPFCLDIQYLLCKAFTKAGIQYATSLAIAKREIEDFLARFNGVELLLFSDGQPFASDITKEFFTNLNTSTQIIKASNSNDENSIDIITLIRSEYAENISNKDFFGAMTKIHNKRLRLQGADLLKLKLEEIRLLLLKKHVSAATAIASEVEESLNFHHLEQWDLELSQEILKVLNNVWLAHGKSEKSKEKSAEILARLYRLNPALVFL